MSKNKPRIYYALIILAMTLLAPSFARAACTWSGTVGTAASAMNTDVAQCVSDASSRSGDLTILMPSSTVTWNGAVTVNMSSGWTNVTSLTIRGASDCTLDANGRPTACGTNITGFNLSYTGVDGKGFRVAHVRATGVTSGHIDGSGKSWRFDHIFFDHVTHNGGGDIFRMNSSVATAVSYGLFDHNNILEFQALFFRYQPDGDGGNYGWMRPLGLGTADAIYFEDNSFNNTTWVANNAPVDANGPGRFVFRYNYVRNTYLMAHDAIVNSHRGVRKWEVYNNTFVGDGDANTNPCFWFAGRGGTGVIFNNTVTDPWTSRFCGGADGIQFAIYRVAKETDCGAPWCSYCSTTPNPMAILNTSSNYPQLCSSGTGCIRMDGTSTVAGQINYPCRDQFGVDQASDGSQFSKPMLLWNNRRNGHDLQYELFAGNYIQDGRDFCHDPNTMPATCNGIASNYQPYVYPHPLTTAGGLTSTAARPAPPSLLQVN